MSTQNNKKSIFWEGILNSLDPFCFLEGPDGVRRIARILNDTKDKPQAIVIFDQNMLMPNKDDDSVRDYIDNVNDWNSVRDDLMQSFITLTQGEPVIYGQRTSV
jgi:hypothetical protein